MIALHLIAVFCVAAVPSVSARSLLDKYEETLSRVHSFHATVESRGSLDGGVTWRLMDTIRVIKSGGRERIRMAMKAFPNNGVMEDELNFQEWFNTPEGTWDINGFDVDNPPSGSVSYIDHEITGKGPKVTGRISTLRGRGPHGYVGNPGPTALGFAVSPRYSLREMSHFAGDVAPTQGRDGRGDSTWILRVRPKEGKFAYEVHLNPQYGYMISAWRMTGGSDIAWQVDEFQEPAPGVFIAKATHRTIKRPELKVPIRVADTIAVTDVNRPIPESELRLDYPAGILISDERDQSFNIWGDGEPAIKFKSQSEFLQWRMDRIAAAMKARRRWWTEPVNLTVMVGSALLLLGLVAYRRRLARIEAGAA